MNGSQIKFELAPTPNIVFQNTPKIFPTVQANTEKIIPYYRPKEIKRNIPFGATHQAAPPVYPLTTPAPPLPHFPQQEVSPLFFNHLATTKRYDITELGGEVVGGKTSWW